MPAASLRHQATAPVSADVVWARLQDPATWATVAGVDSTSQHRFQDGRLSGFRFTTSIGGVRYGGDADVTTARPGQEMTLSIRSHEITGQITVRIERGETGTELDVEMRMRPAGLVGSMVFPLVSGAVSNGFEDSVERLAEAMA